MQYGETQQTRPAADDAKKTKAKSKSKKSHKEAKPQQPNSNISYNTSFL